MASRYVPSQQLLFSALYGYGIIPTFSNGTPKQRSRHKQTTSLGLRRMLLFANFVGPCSAEDSILYFYADLLHPMPESAVG